MSAAGSRILKIPAGQEFSDIMLTPWESGMGIAYITTTDTISLGLKIELHMQSKKDSTKWLPFFDPEKGENAALTLVQDKVIPCSPYVDGRGSRAMKFKVSSVQANDVFLEVGLTKLFG